MLFIEGCKIQTNKYTHPDRTYDDWEWVATCGYTYWAKEYMPKD